VAQLSTGAQLERCNSSKQAHRGRVYNRLRIPRHSHQRGAAPRRGFLYLAERS
jgi:hypothetical protein